MLETKAQTVASGRAEEAALATRVIAAIGGLANVLDVAACMSRLRIKVLNPARLDEGKLMTLPAAGITRTDAHNLQIVLGTGSEQIRECIAEAANKMQLLTLVAPLDGDIIPLDEFPDEVFAKNMLGIGVGILPSGNSLVAPTTAVVAKIFPGGHAVVLKTPTGLEILLHLGLDTVSLQGHGFLVLCQAGETVQEGQPLVKFDKEIITAAGRKLHSALVILNTEVVLEHQEAPSGQVGRGRSPVMVVRH
ncbi:MAG: PTS system N-acetylglucosamine-specific EIICBA component [Firmicutes bacterium]|nr:PTS system N-acetylglucosamine-specific EIICBA component [candidate division NPL-UPA2 bacterium]